MHLLFATNFLSSWIVWLNLHFFAFPDLYPEHNAKWCECLSRSIFSSINELWQQIWCILCRFGQSQGLHPKALIKIPISHRFSYYTINFLSQEGLESESYCIYDQEHCIHSSMLYRTVRTAETYNKFFLDLEAKLQSFSKMIGEMVVVGVRCRKPKVDCEHDIRLNDAVNMMTKMELFISKSNLRLKLYAFKHNIGDTTTNQWLSSQLLAPQPQETPQVTIRSTRINSKFD